MTPNIVGQCEEMMFALYLAGKAGDIALRYYQQGVDATMKGDNTPVTIADQECERLIRDAIAEHYPDDAILGEEEGESSHRHARRKWIIDPIDGTYNFARGVPIWSLLLALEDAGEIVVGILHAPAMGETYWAQKGGGTHRNGEPVKVSSISSAAESMFTFGAPSRFAQPPLWDGLHRIIAGTYRQRAFGDYLNFAHVFSGKAEAAMETGLKPWDIAPMKILAEEAGGRFTDLDGGSSIYKGNCLVSNGLVHDEILRLLSG
jgi:histidinol-phosphatase